MASPDPGRYPHHLYSHQDHQQLTPLPPPPHHHHHQGHVSHEVYGGERPYHPYPEPAQHQPYPPPPPQPEPEQPLDLSVSRSPRPPSAGSLTGSEGGASKRPRLEDGSRELAAVDMGRGGHSSMCMIRGCNCHSPMPVHHTPHYSRHRHSPYPQYPVSGHSSPSVGEAQPYPHPYSIPQPPPPSSPGMMYGGGGNSSSNSSNSSSSSYLPQDSRHHLAQDSRHHLAQDSRHHLAQDSRHSRSPGMGVAYSAAELAPQRPSPGALLCPPPHSSISPLSISTHGRDPSPCPPRESLAPMRDMSPRPPFYRPFEDMPGAPHAAPVISSSSSSGSRVSAPEPYPSEDDLSASSTLLMLSNTTSSKGSRPPALTQQTADSSADSFRRREGAMEDNAPLQTEPSQSDSGRAGVFHQPPLPPPPPPPPAPLPHTSPSPRASHAVVPLEMSQPCSREAVSQACHKENQPLGPAQDGTVASSYSSDDLTDSPSPKQQEEKKGKSLQSRLVKVVGTTPLATLREERAKKQAAKRAKMKELLTHRSSEHYSANSNDSEGASDQNSSGQASPRSSDGSDNDVGQGFPIPPDPNLKMSALDYLISKVLVERIDVPFKACNSEIQQIYSGAKKGRLTLVDLIELQVEASLKA